MACPRCHTEGTVRVSRLNQEIACKKCGTSFRITETGRVLTASEAEAARQPASMWERSPRWVKYGLTSAVTVSLAMVIAILWQPGEEIPTDIIGRSRTIAESVARNFPGSVRSVTTPGTQKEAAEWTTLVRPRAWDKHVTSEVPMRIEVKLLFTTSVRCATLATVLPGASETSSSLEDAHLVVRGEAVRAGQGGTKKEAKSPVSKFNELTLLIYWVKVDGDWLLDGKTTLENARIGTRDQY
jgi:hypothetical protein